MVDDPLLFKIAITLPLIMSIALSGSIKSAKQNIRKSRAKYCDQSLLKRIGII
jgi:hypothetical protein